MITSGFDYHAPGTVAEAIGLLTSLGDEAKILAGGHSLLPMMKLRLAEPAHLIDLGLDYFCLCVLDDSQLVVPLELAYRTVHDPVEEQKRADEHYDGQASPVVHSGLCRIQNDRVKICGKSFQRADVLS